MRSSGTLLRLRLINLGEMVKLSEIRGMRWRFVALASLAVNVAVGVAWVGYRQPGPAEKLSPQAAVEAGSNQPQSNVVVRRQFFSWSEVESSDYPTYIANLRQIGCLEQTIRDIIIADVNAFYSKRRATELVTSDQQWWRSEPDPAVVQAAIEKAAALETERRSLLTSLLGTNW